MPDRYAHPPCLQAALPARAGAAADGADRPHAGAERHHRGLPQKVHAAQPDARRQRATAAQAHRADRDVSGAALARQQSKNKKYGAPVQLSQHSLLAGCAPTQLPALTAPPPAALSLPLASPTRCCRRAIKTECAAYSELLKVCGQDKSAAELAAFALTKQQEFEQVGGCLGVRAMGWRFQRQCQRQQPGRPVTDHLTGGSVCNGCVQWGPAPSAPAAPPAPPHTPPPAHPARSRAHPTTQPPTLATLHRCRMATWGLRSWR